MSSADRIDALMAIVRGEVVELPPLPAREERYVPPSGPLDAAIIVIGESAGEDEVERGKPFIGKSGQKLRQWMRYARVDPASCYIDNTYPYLPPGKKAKNIPPERLAEEEGKLHARLSKLTDAKVIVPVGNLALKAILGLEGITKYRGSVYEWKGIPAIPLIHPAMILRGQEKMERRCYLDWLRIKRAAQERPVIPQVECITNPSICDFAALVDSLKSALYLSIDIETKPSEGRILCVGFATSPSKAYVFEWPKDENAIRTLCAFDIDKVFWNHAYDVWWLLNNGVPIKGRIIDGMHMMHCLVPTDNVSLAYAASIYTFQPYWKDQSKDEDDKTAEENWEQFKVYNALDAATPLTIIPRLQASLDERGYEAFYVENYEEMSEPIMDVMLRGVRIDQERRKQVEFELLEEARQKRDELATYNDGEPLFTLSTVRDRYVYKEMQSGVYTFDALSVEQAAKSLGVINAKTVSTTKLRNLLYGKYGIPAVLKKRASGEETETIDIFTLRKLRYDYRDNAEVSKIIDLAIEHTRAQKLASFISDDKFDEDGRMRFSLKQTTETLRLASSASPRGRKVNSQNIPREARVRSLILPEKGHVCLQVDGSAAESRVCFVRTGDEELVRLSRLRSDEYDQHRHTGVIVGFARTSDETPTNFATVTKLQRQLCKPISHGAQRAMQGITLAQTILREGLKDEHGDLIVYTVEHCDKLIENYHRRFPAIRQWHQRVRAQLRREKKLTNSWGFTWPVEFADMKDELYRRAYSFLLQSDIAQWLNLRGFKATHYWLKRNKMRSRIMLQEHDGLVLSCAPDEAYDVATFMRDSLEEPWLCGGRAIAIPVEFQLGPHWGGGTEFKQLPAREEFEAVGHECTNVQ